MKIERLTGLRFGGHVETIVILTEMQFAINHLIDAHNATQPEQSKDMTFEEALVHLRNGKYIKRENWLISYLSKDQGFKFTLEDFNANDWRVIE